MRTIDNRGTPTRTTSTLDLFDGIDVPKKVARKINETVGEFLVEQITGRLQTTATSPISGESFPALTKKYKAFKIEQGGNPIPDMLLTGDMLSSLDFRATDVLEIGFFDKEAWKADGHNKFSGKKNFTPQRRFLPAEGQKFKRDIVSGVKDLIVEGLIDADLQEIIDEIGL